MAFPIKVICFISGLQTYLGLLCSEFSKSRGPVKPSARAEAGVDPAQAGARPPPGLESFGQRGLGPGLSPLRELLCTQPRPILLPALLQSFSMGPQGRLPSANALKGQWSVGWGRHASCAPGDPCHSPLSLPDIFWKLVSVQA